MVTASELLTTVKFRVDELEKTANSSSELSKAAVSDSSLALKTCQTLSDVYEANRATHVRIVIRCCICTA